MGAFVDLQADHVLREADVLPKPLIVGRHQALPERRAPLVAGATAHKGRCAVRRLAAAAAAARPEVVVLLVVVVVETPTWVSRAEVEVGRNCPENKGRVDLRRN